MNIERLIIKTTILLNATKLDCLTVWMKEKQKESVETRVKSVNNVNRCTAFHVDNICATVVDDAFLCSLQIQMHTELRCEVDRQNN